MNCIQHGGFLSRKATLEKLVFIHKSKLPVLIVMVKDNFVVPGANRCSRETKDYV